ncbi:CDP-alcohol phosphatidyltransferase family protein [Ornithinimicrobium avium]|uniref:CDP-alcohol phosphatidyltransferase family protein n=1 Tax=Ornithinimicrobium avium TaxID=2283195 RepID=UPI0013B3676A|nr:CDP-alcohol phosphatidyltransferase family protein [Ornithinimicrobium avium]
MDPTPTTSARSRPATPGDVVTLARVVPVLAAAGLVVGALATGGEPRTWWVAGLGGLAWAGDALDGYVARRTSSVTDRGAALDSAVDGALVLVLSLAVAPVAPWALVGGLLFPAFALVQVRRPAWRRPLPPSPRRRLLGGVMAGTLVLACAPVWPAAVVQVAVGAAVVLVTWSFVVDVRWLERAAPGRVRNLH